jgi:hypothetical protein
MYASYGIASLGPSEILFGTIHAPVETCCSEGERFHASVTGAACVLFVGQRGKDGEGFLKMFPWSFCVRVFAALPLLAMVLLSPADAQTPRLEAARVAGGFTAPVLSIAGVGFRR